MKNELLIGTALRYFLNGLEANHRGNCFEHFCAPQEPPGLRLAYRQSRRVRKPWPPRKAQKSRTRSGFCKRPACWHALANVYDWAGLNE
jgi:hypothetical protein